MEELAEWFKPHQWYHQCYPSGITGDIPSGVLSTLWLRRIKNCRILQNLKNIAEFAELLEFMDKNSHYNE